MALRRTKPRPSKALPVRNKAAGSGVGNAAGGVAKVALPLSEQGAVPEHDSVKEITSDARASENVPVESWKLPRVNRLSAVLRPL